MKRLPVVILMRKLVAKGACNLIDFRNYDLVYRTNLYVEER